ncbi:MAG: hypothetical protein C5B51_19485 [Terriglobia bacterium]|nr:MAG: hypothetical protein C5B51_19485 [Terriglobia bacterium]
MRQVLKFAKRVAASEAPTILIEGESGVGKASAARECGRLSRSAGMVGRARGFDDGWL